MIGWMTRLVCLLSQTSSTASKLNTVDLIAERPRRLCEVNAGPRIRFGRTRLFVPCDFVMKPASSELRRRVLHGGPLAESRPPLLQAGDRLEQRLGIGRHGQIGEDRREEAIGETDLRPGQELVRALEMLELGKAAPHCVE